MTILNTLFGVCSYNIKKDPKGYIEKTVGQGDSSWQ